MKPEMIDGGVLAFIKSKTWDPNVGAMDEKGFVEFLEKAMKPSEHPKALALYCPMCEGFSTATSQCRHHETLLRPLLAWRDGGEEGLREWQFSVFSRFTKLDNGHYRWECSCGTYVLEDDGGSWSDGMFLISACFLDEAREGGHAPEGCSS